MYYAVLRLVNAKKGAVNFHVVESASLQSWPGSYFLEFASYAAALLQLVVVRCVRFLEVVYLTPLACGAGHLELPIRYG